MASSKTILITGGSDGLGKALAGQLTRNGHRVIILAPNLEKVKGVAEEIGCSYQQCDITDWAAVETAVKAANDELGRIDVLINNAGVAFGGPIDEVDPDKAQQVFAVNVFGAIYLAKAVVPLMKQQGDGHIININSQGGLYAKAERTLYTGSKWAMTGITKVWQMELAPHNIKVAGLYPGALEGVMLKNGQRAKREGGLEYEQIGDAIEYILSRKPGTLIPELGIMNL